MNITNLKIDMEFASKIPPLTGEELMRLHESILTEGRCISPIVVWDGVIVDGHNRYRFLSRHPEIEYEVYEKNFLDRNDGIAWICKNQLGRRNLTPEQKKYLIGKQYEAEKQTLGGERDVARDENGQFTAMYQNDTHGKKENTGERIARENNVSRISVIRAEKYANAVDLAEEAMPGIKDEILSGAIHATDTEIIKIAQTAHDKRPAIVEKLRQPKPPKAQKPSSEKMTFNPKHYEKPALRNETKLLTVSGVLCDIGEAADMFIITWAKLQREYSDFLHNEEMVTGVREYIEEIRKYMQTVEEFLAKHSKSES